MGLPVGAPPVSAVRMNKLLAGFLAALAMAAVMFAVRLVFGVSSLPEALVDWATAVLPLPLFESLLSALGAWAKPLLVVSLFIAQVVLLGILGALWLLWQSTWGKERNLWGFGLGLSLLLWAGALALAPARDFRLALSWLPPFLAYGLFLVLSPQRRLLPVSASRRRLLVGISAAATLGLLLALAGRFLPRVRRGEAPSTATPEVTPNQDFYAVSKNLVDPLVDAATWKLTLTGLLERPATLSYEELLALPWVEQFLTLGCISNGLGGNLIGNARWRGVPLGEMLRPSGIRQGVRKVVLKAADGYSDSITLEKALEPGTLLAYLMNGEPLAREHGFPARLLVPGIYGMKNVKWLTAVELVDYDFRGYWQQRGWSDGAAILTMSRIDSPRGRESLAAGEKHPMAGIAFAGDRGVSRVEVSIDGGRSWLPAQVKPALSPYTWVLWTREWSPPPGSYTLQVRAADGSGEFQSGIEHGPLPNGTTGYHTVSVLISPGGPDA